jgi:hypothetical protein
MPLYIYTKEVSEADCETFVCRFIYGADQDPFLRKFHAELIAARCDAAHVVEFAGSGIRWQRSAKALRTRADRRLREAQPYPATKSRI